MARLVQVHVLSGPGHVHAPGNSHPFRPTNSAKILGNSAEVLELTYGGFFSVRNQ